MSTTEPFGKLQRPHAWLRGSSLRPYANAGPALLLVVAGFVMASYGALLNDLWPGVFLRDCIFLGLGVGAEMIVIVIGGIDLSIGANCLIVALTVAKFLSAGGTAAVFAIPVGLIIGLAIGFGNGLIIWLGAGNPFIVTLGTTAVLQGIALTISANAVSGIPAWYATIYSAKLGPLPDCVIVAALLCALAAIGLRYSRLGRALYAIGGNARSARWAGINQGHVTISAYCIAGLFASVAGLFVVAEDQLGDPAAGATLAFSSIAAAAVGGLSLYGGRGRVLGAVAGVIVLTGLITMSGDIGINAFYQELIEGLVILLGAGLSSRF